MWFHRYMFPWAEHSLSLKVAIFTAWSFFVLINAYYGGALTMFFSTEASIPFNSIAEVMRNKEYKLIHQMGRECIKIINLL